VGCILVVRDGEGHSYRYRVTRDKSRVELPSQIRRHPAPRCISPTTRCIASTVVAVVVVVVVVRLP